MAITFTTVASGVRATHSRMHELLPPGTVVTPEVMQELDTYLDAIKEAGYSTLNRYHHKLARSNRMLTPVLACEPYPYPIEDIGVMGTDVALKYNGQDYTIVTKTQRIVEMLNAVREITNRMNA